MGYFSCKADSSISTADDSRPSSGDYLKIRQFTYVDLESATDGFSATRLLGRGSHGLVYKAILRSGHSVAVKKPSQKSTEVDNEIQILSEIQNPRFVNLLGFTVSDPQHRLLVVEFMANGTLYDALHTDTRRPPTWGRRIKLALQTAKAIETLHSLNPPVIHRDIKSANVLMDKNFDARLGDFGLALRCVDGLRLRSTPPAGTMGYLDPCYVTPDHVSTKTDVFSFGILLLEIITGRKAIDMANSPPSVVDWAVPLIRRGKVSAVYDGRVPPPRDAAVRNAVAVVAAKCVRSCRERRPSMKEVVECLTELSRVKLTPPATRPWNGLSNPCMAVEAVGKPVRVRATRVYSELGVGSSNLMDLILMSGPDSHAEADQAVRVN